MEPIVERITFGLYKSTQFLLKIIPVTPAPSAVLRIVPIFPGSCKSSRIIRNGAFSSFVFKISLIGVSTLLIKHKIPCGVTVSDRFLNTLSSTSSNFPFFSVQPFSRITL